MENVKTTCEDAFNLGVHTGIKLMENKIQEHCELGKPVMANGELFFFKTARQNLIDIMDDLDEECGVEKERKYIVPICITHNSGKVGHEIIIKTDNPKAAMLIAIGDFERNGWIVDRDFDNYKCLEQG